MPDTKVSNLTETAAGAAEITDALYMVDDPGGSPASRRVEIGNLFPQKTTAQMSAITPTGNERPVIYNTDIEMLVLWNGTAWVSIADGLPV